MFLLVLLQTAFIQIRLWDIPLCAAGTLPLLDHWMVFIMACLFLRQSLTTVYDYLINIRAKREKGWLDRRGRG